MMGLRISYAKIKQNRLKAFRNVGKPSDFADLKTIISGLVSRSARLLASIAYPCCHILPHLQLEHAAESAVATVAALLG